MNVLLPTFGSPNITNLNFLEIGLLIYYLTINLLINKNKFFLIIIPYYKKYLYFYYI